MQIWILVIVIGIVLVSFGLWGFINRICEGGDTKFGKPCSNLRELTDKLNSNVCGQQNGIMVGKYVGRPYGKGRNNIFIAEED